MKYLYLLLSITFAVHLINCNDSSNPVTFDEQLNKWDMSFETFSSDTLNSKFNFRTHLSGDEEVPPVNTRAQGEAIFRVSRDSSSVYYKVIAANIKDITMAHIHLAPAGTNGGVVVWLYPSQPPAQLIPGRLNGILAEGTIVDSNLVGALAGMTIADLLNEMINGNTYVNVHTEQNPGGEIRGQLNR